MEKQVRNILMVGVGGQGIILASDILSRAAMYTGYDVKKSEIHGMSQRGGSVFSHIRYGEKVHSPMISEGGADILFSLEVMETLRWLSYANDQSTVIALRTRIKPAGVEEYPDGMEEELERRCRKLKFIDPERLRARLDDVKFLNVSLLGVLSCHIDIPDDAWEKAIEQEVPDGSFEGNWNAFHEGKKY